MHRVSSKGEMRRIRMNETSVKRQRKRERR